MEALENFLAQLCRNCFTMQYQMKTTWKHIKITKGLIFIKHVAIRTFLQNTVHSLLSGGARDV